MSSPLTLSRDEATGTILLYVFTGLGQERIRSSDGIEEDPEAESQIMLGGNLELPIAVRLEQAYQVKER